MDKGQEVSDAVIDLLDSHELTIPEIIAILEIVKFGYMLSATQGVRLQ